MELDGPSAARPSPARGVVLIAVVVVLGLFLLRAMDDDPTLAFPEADRTAPDASGAADDGSADPDDDAGGSGGEDDGSGDDEDATPPAPQLREPSELTVMVLNGSGVGGAAAAQTEKITSAGYQHAPADNAPEVLAETQVQYAEGYEAEASALAEAIGASGDATAPIAPDLGVDLQGSQLVVLLGLDLAGG